MFYSFIFCFVYFRFIDIKAQAYSTETETNESEVETEYESDWMDRPFVRDRLKEQILAGGGKVYENFNEIPKNEYKNTKLITNVPNTTAKNIWCLSAGIPAYNHRWIIRCCLEVSQHFLLMLQFYINQPPTRRIMRLSSLSYEITLLLDNILHTV